MSVDSFLDTLHGELAFFRAITRARPVGVHRYFHVVTIRQLIKEETGSDVAVEEIWDKLRACYNLEALEGLEFYDPENESPNSNTPPSLDLPSPHFTTSPEPTPLPDFAQALVNHPHFHSEFALPHNDFDTLISPRRVNTHGSPASDGASAGRRSRSRGATAGVKRKKSTMAGAGLVGGDSDSSELTEGEGDDDVSARVGSVFTTTEGGEDGEEMEGGEDDAGPSTKTRSKKAASGTSQRGKKKSSAGASSSTRAKTASTQAKKKKKR